jgi:hypothetical protein
LYRRDAVYRAFAALLDATQPQRAQRTCNIARASIAMQGWVLVFLVVPALLGPVCSAHIDGGVTKEATEADMKAMRAAASEGRLQVCSASLLHLRVSLCCSALLYAGI